MISLFGESDVKDAHMRLRVFNGTNKLYPQKPIHSEIATKGSFKYYWFVMTGANAEYW